MVTTVARKSTFKSGDLTDTAVYVMLALLEPRHGYAVGQYLADATGDALNLGPATLYTTLGKLHEEGLIEELSSADAKRVYRATPSGRDILTRNIDRRRRMVDLAEKLMEEL